MNSLQKSCHSVLHTPTGGMGHFWDGCIAFFILGSVALAPLHIIPYFEDIHHNLWLIEAFITVIFTFEYLLKIWSSEKTLPYIFSLIGIIDILSLIPFYLTWTEILMPSVFVISFINGMRILKLILIYIKERKALSEDVQNGYCDHGDFIMLQDEKIHAIIQKHPILFLMSLIPVFIFTLFAVLSIAIFGLHIPSIAAAAICITLALIIFVKNWLNFHYDVIYVTDHRLVIQDKNIFGVDRNSILYQSITNIHPSSSGLSKLIFGYGEIIIETATTSQEKIVFDFAPNPGKTIRVISENQRRMANSPQPENIREISHPLKIQNKTPFHNQNILKNLQKKIKNRIYNLGK